MNDGIPPDDLERLLNVGGFDQMTPDERAFFGEAIQHFGKLQESFLAIGTSRKIDPIKLWKLWKYLLAYMAESTVQSERETIDNLKPPEAGGRRM